MKIKIGSAIFYASLYLWLELDLMGLEWQIISLFSLAICIICYQKKTNWHAFLVCLFLWCLEGLLFEPNLYLRGLFVPVIYLANHFIEKNLLSKSVRYYLLTTMAWGAITVIVHPNHFSYLDLVSLVSNLAIAKLIEVIYRPR